jgi:hypothetical protein
MKLYVQIFTRTFAQLSLAVLLAAQGMVWVTGHDARINVTTMALGLLMAAIGGLVAAGYAYARTPAETALGKAIRSAVQTVAAGLATLAINQVGDFAAAGTVLTGLVVATALAFGVTYLQNVAPPAPTP